MRHHSRRPCTDHAAPLRRGSRIKSGTTIEEVYGCRSVTTKEVGRRHPDCPPAEATGDTAAPRPALRRRPRASGNLLPVDSGHGSPSFGGPRLREGDRDLAVTWVVAPVETTKLGITTWAVVPAEAGLLPRPVRRLVLSSFHRLTGGERWWHKPPPPRGRRGTRPPLVPRSAVVLAQAGTSCWSTAATGRRLSKAPRPRG